MSEETDTKCRPECDYFMPFEEKFIRVYNKPPRTLEGRIKDGEGICSLETTASEQVIRPRNASCSHPEDSTF